MVHGCIIRVSKCMHACMLALTFSGMGFGTRSWVELSVMRGGLSPSMLPLDASVTSEQVARTCCRGEASCAMKLTCECASSAAAARDLRRLGSILSLGWPASSSSQPIRTASKSSSGSAAKKQRLQGA